MTSPDLDEFQKNMAEANVKMYAELVKSNRRHTRLDQWFFWWFLAFGSGEMCLTTYYAVKLDWWALSSFTIGASQFVMAWVNRKTHARHLDHGVDWQQKYDEAVEKLESLDPASELLPEIIEEEP